ncbi:DNA alkylation repair protein [Gracilimonas halophila]|uniref:DNA alkylation repair protein n=1 Tax=Gracilimonas halophila TaxID=1834464 RepID=A0ABW5JKA6_9BACT
MFKTGPGEYGEGDEFLGIKVPEQRKVAKLHKDLPAAEIRELLQSKYHEVRLTALMLMVYKVEKGSSETLTEMTKLYLDNLHSINNWDLTDSSCHHILGRYLENRDRDLLYKFARSEDLWKKRIAIVTCYRFIKNNDFTDALNIAEILMNDDHDLIHKAVGWMDKDLGFSASDVLTVELNVKDQEKAYQISNLLSTEIRSIPGVEEVSIIASHYRSDPRMIEHRYGIGMGSMKASTTLESVADNGGLTLELVDENYLETMDIELLQGRDFALDRPSDIENGILVNKSFADNMGWKNPVGQIIEDKAGWGESSIHGKEVIGVVEDFHFEPLYKQLQPIVLKHLESDENSYPGTVLVKTASGSMSETISKISGMWNQIAQQEPFSYNLLDEMVALQYMEEQRWRNIIQFASFMAIALACFGLFGLAALSAQRRTKEIGIRKVMGATLTNIITLLSKDFVKLIIAGFVIAIPIAWYAVHQWLSEFAYRIELGPGIFIFAGLTAFIIALLTVSWQSIKAAVANPVESLRSE